MSTEKNGIFKKSDSVRPCTCNCYGVESSALKFLMGEAETLIERVRQTLGRDVSKSVKNRRLFHNRCLKTCQLSYSLAWYRAKPWLPLTNCSFLFKLPLLPSLFNIQSLGLLCAQRGLLHIHSLSNRRLPLCPSSRREDGNLFSSNYDYNIKALIWSSSRVGMDLIILPCINNHYHPCYAPNNYCF